MNRFSYTILCSLQLKQFFFSTDHCQKVLEGQSIDPSFVACSGSLPIHVVPRPSCPDGVVDTLEKYIMIFHDDEKEIANPDPAFQPKCRPAPKEVL